MCHALGPQRSDAGEAPTRGPSVSSQALYHWATALPFLYLYISCDSENKLEQNNLFYFFDHVVGLFLKVL